MTRNGAYSQFLQVALTLADGTTHTVDMYNDSNEEGAMVGRIKLDAGQAFVGNKVALHDSHFNVATSACLVLSVSN